MKAGETTIAPTASTEIRLFDQMQRTDLTPATHAEPRFPYLNRSARSVAVQVRSLLEVWFSRYPTEEQAELRARFRSVNGRTHAGAFFELYLHELLVRTACRVHVHPRVPTGDKRPDFLATTDGGEKFYCEATVAFDASHDDEAAESRLNDLHDALDRADSPNFFFNLVTDGSPQQPLPLRLIRRAAEDFVRDFNPDDIAAHLLAGAGLDDLPALQMEHHGCTIQIRPLPKSPGLRGKPGIRALGSMGTGASMVDDARAPRDAVIRKASRYGELEHPYLVAVNAQSQWLDRIDMMEALFGKETLIISAEMDSRSEPGMRRRPDGAWTRPGGPRYTRVSAVLFVSSLVPWSITSKHSVPWLFHNPWAKRPMPAVLDVLSHGRPIPSEPRMAFTPGLSTAELFGLPEDWPHGGSN